jgi:hypothetical protein
MTIDTIRVFMNNFFNPAIATKQLHNELKEHRSKIKSLKMEYKSLSEWNHQYVSTLSLLTEAMAALIWKKDKNHRYLLANPLHCRIFFGYDSTQDCLRTIVGKTDLELIKLNFDDIGIKNNFDHVTLLSDKYAATNTEVSHFLEAGTVGSTELLVYTIKIPQFTPEGAFVGTIGMAWDMTENSDFLVTQLKRWIYSKKAVQLYHKKDVFCYVVAPELKKCHIFHHICPTPERGKECDGQCEMCKLKDGKDGKMGSNKKF